MVHKEKKARSEDRTLGTQLLIDLYDCEQGLLDDQKAVERALVQAARAANATVVETVLHRFSPQGVSGVIVIAESHLAVHTWPEHGYAALDVFTCSGRLDPDRIVEELKRAFSAGRCESRLVMRGPDEFQCSPRPTAFNQENRHPPS